MNKQTTILLALLNLLLLAIHTANAQSTTKQIQYLSGKDNIHTVQWDFWCTGGRNSGYWSTIAVPSCWEQQGFGSYNYGRDYVTYGKHFRFADEKGIYRHRFSVPASWKNQTVKLVFEGAMTDTEVKINGKSAGPIHQGAFYRFDYDITDKLSFSKPNQIEVTVSKMSADKSVNNAERLADYWVFGGIFRPVYLEATPRQHITHLAINATADGAFAMNALLEQATPGTEVAAEITDAKGKIVGRANATIAAGDSLVFLTTKVDNPKCWTAETPNLYKVSVSLMNKGKEIYMTREQFGFRTIEVRKGDGIYVNGVKVKMKGVNRHVWWPETGRSVNAAIDLQDVQLIKGMNMNAVRCSHYPPDQSFLHYCDSLGLYVLDELAGWQKAYSTNAGKPLVREMVLRDVNHPSVIFWSNGNEGGHNMELDNEFAKYDLSARPVIHVHHKPGKAFNGIDCNHYEDYYSTKKILADSNIYMVTEFQHAQDDGAGAAGLSDLWELHWNSKLGAGGFIWALLDEGVVRTDKHNIIDVNGINAPDGILGPHREKEGSYNAIKEIFCPVRITMKQLPEGFKGSIPVENRYHFTNLNECRYRWELVRFRKPGDIMPGAVVSKAGVVVPPSISPGQQGTLNIDLPADWNDYEGLVLAANDPSGNELFKWTWTIKSNTALLDSIVSITGKEPVAASETDSSITLKGGGIGITISKKNGRLLSLSNDYSKPLSFNNGPVLVSGKATFEHLKYYKAEDAYVIECTYSGDLKKVIWKMQPSGWVELNYQYELNGTYPFAGISFSYPQNYVLGAKWLGLGPYRVWKNRMAGTMLNVWDNAYNNTQTGASPWLFPEFKGYFGNIIWLQMDTDEGKFTVASKDDGLFIRLFDFYGLTGPDPSPELPTGDISFLDAIPPIGSKLAFNMNRNAAVLGPQSEMNVLSGIHSRTLYFYFGLEKSTSENRQFKMPEENILTD